MKNFILFSLLLVSFIGLAQTSTLEINVEEQNGELIFNGQNNGTYPIASAVVIKNTEGLRGNKRPSATNLDIGESKILATLNILGQYSYEYESHFDTITSHLNNNEEVTNTFEKTETPKQATFVKKQRKARLPRSKFILRDLSKVNTGIVVFDKTDCPRCNHTTAYLYEHKIPFKIVDVSKNKKGQALMQKLVRDDGNKGGFTTPVILIDGIISYSHENLNAFLSQLK